jgi:NAD(P)H-flavin reductase
MSTRSLSALATNPWLCSTAVIESIQPEIAGVATYHLALADRGQAERYRFRPGQFNMLYIPGAGEIPISLSADPRSRGAWAHTIRLAGNVTHSLARLLPGQTLGLRGPYGTSWPIDEARGADVLLVAGGIGLAPLRPALYALMARSAEFGELALLCGARSPDTLLYRNEYDLWRQRGFDVQTIVDRASPNWQGAVGVVSLLVDRLRLRNPHATMLFTCGPEVMMRYVVRSALERGIAPENIFCSLERNMQCAVGLCGHCQFGPDFVCKDGPIFRYDRLRPFLTVEAL